MYEIKVVNIKNIWWNFLSGIMKYNSEVVDRTKEEQLDIINQALLEYNAMCFFDPPNTSRLSAKFETEADYIVFKLRFS